MQTKARLECQELKKINERLEQLQRVTSKWPDWKKVVTYTVTSSVVEQVGNTGGNKK